MKTYVFTCTSSGSLYALTDDATGAKLPASECSGGWAYWKEVKLGPGMIACDPVAAAADIGKTGYHLVRAGVLFTARADEV